MVAEAYVWKLATGVDLLRARFLLMWLPLGRPH